MSIILGLSIRWNEAVLSYTAVNTIPRNEWIVIR